MVLLGSVADGHHYSWQIRELVGESERETTMVMVQHPGCFCLPATLVHRWEGTVVPVLRSHTP